MLSVSQLAKKYGISRATVLYYERKGLLKPTSRSDNGYRWYGQQQEKILKEILEYRALGLPVSQLGDLLEQRSGESREEILREQFSHLSNEIDSLRAQQRNLLLLLGQKEMSKQQEITKDKWVEIMQAAGFNKQDRMNWHREFEKRAPENHQRFLRSLGIGEDEIAIIRNL